MEAETFRDGAITVGHWECGGSSAPMEAETG